MSPSPQKRCTVQTVLDLIGGKWKTLIVYHLLPGTKRFSELRRLLPDVTQRMLTRQLRELENDGIVIRTVHAEIPPRVEYSLTDLGHSLKPVLESLQQWGLAHLGEINKLYPTSRTA